MKAVAVDGVGSTREIEIQDGLRCLRFPIPRPIQVTALPDVAPTALDMSCAEFLQIGRIPDGRHVYGYRFHLGGQYALWKVTVSWVLPIDEKGLNAIRREVDTQIEALASEPIVRLYDVEHEDPATRVIERTVMGVARRGEA